jgi:hypothetical protein
LAQLCKWLIKINPNTDLIENRKTLHGGASHLGIGGNIPKRI